LSEYPNNPGAAHYIIHAADTAELAAEALPAAREYAAIAPASPHALHMPSHIFNRLGYWKESISTNQASARVAAEWIKNGRDGLSDEFHALNNLEYGYLQLGQDAQARRIIEQINTLAASRAGDSWAPIDARIYYDLETHDWPDALKVEPPAGSPFEENFDAYWIRAIAAARSGKPHEAELALEDFRKSSDQFIKGHGWADILHVALVEAEAWTVYAQGQHEKAVELLTSIREFERDHPMYYADVLPRPTPEMLGDMLLQYGRSAEALTAYKEALDLAPNRLDSLLGGETSAARSGNAQLSADYASKVNAEGATPVFRP
jgi:tetratricopeptide (TPR) repeat protein